MALRADRAGLGDDGAIQDLESQQIIVTPLRSRLEIAQARKQREAEQRQRADDEAEHERPEPAAAPRHPAGGGSTTGVATMACSRSIMRRAT